MKSTLATLIPMLTFTSLCTTNCAPPPGGISKQQQSDSASPKSLTLTADSPFYENELYRWYRAATVRVNESTRTIMTDGQQIAAETKWQNLASRLKYQCVQGTRQLMKALLDPRHLKRDAQFLIVMSHPKNASSTQSHGG